MSVCEEVKQRRGCEQGVLKHKITTGKCADWHRCNWRLLFQAVKLLAVRKASVC